MNGWGYCGRFDPITGLYLFRHRDYSPTLGNWIEQDPAGYINGANRYQIELGGAADSADPFGLDVLLRLNASAAQRSSAGPYGHVAVLIGSPGRAGIIFQKTAARIRTTTRIGIIKQLSNFWMTEVIARRIKSRSTSLLRRAVTRKCSSTRSGSTRNRLIRSARTAAKFRRGGLRAGGLDTGSARWHGYEKIPVIPDNLFNNLLQEGLHSALPLGGFELDDTVGSAGAVIKVLK